MDCLHFREIASAICDGEASDAEKLEFEEHIRSCHECEMFYNNLKILSAETRKLDVEAPRELRERVSKSVAMMSSKKKPFYSRFKFTAAAAVVAIIACAAGGLFGEQAPETITQDDINSPPSAQVDAGAAPSNARMMPSPAVAEFSIADKSNLSYDTDYSFVIELLTDGVPDILAEIEFEARGEYKYFEVPIEMKDELLSFEHTILPCDENPNSNGLVIIAE